MSTTTIESPPKRLYKSASRNVNIVFPDGKVAAFQGGMYSTNNPVHIEYLDKEIAQNGFGGVIYIDPNARTITAEEENPMRALRKKLFEEFQAEQRAHLNPSNDMGASVQGPLNPASTTDIAPVAIGGDATAHLREAVSARSTKK